MFRNFFGWLIGNKKQLIVDFLNRDAVVIDVRTPAEFDRGHVRGARNIPVDRIKVSTGEIKKWQKPIIVCCASGVRSAQAKTILEQNGIEVMNGGSWTSLAKYI